jgi:hypothetical protein
MEENSIYILRYEDDIRVFTDFETAMKKHLTPFVQSLNEEEDDTEEEMDESKKIERIDSESSILDYETSVLEIYSLDDSVKEYINIMSFDDEDFYDFIEKASDSHALLFQLNDFINDRAKLPEELVAMYKTIC